MRISDWSSDVCSSDLLMNIIPAKVAGVERIVMMTPTPGGEVNPVVMAAAHIGGVDEIWRVGGAQAIAARAHGPTRRAPVDVVTGQNGRATCGGKVGQYVWSSGVACSFKKNKN